MANIFTPSSREFTVGVCVCRACDYKKKDRHRCPLKQLKCKGDASVYDIASHSVGVTRITGTSLACAWELGRKELFNGFMTINITIINHEALRILRTYTKSRILVHKLCSRHFL